MKTLIIYTDLDWSLGALHRGLGIALQDVGWQTKLKSWAIAYDPKLFNIEAASVDRIMTLPPCAHPLYMTYGIPKNKIVVVAHAMSDLQRMIASEGVEWAKEYAGYGVTSDTLAAQSLAAGIRRTPFVVRCGIEFDRFYSKPSGKLETVGYATVMQRFSNGIDEKRGFIAEKAARETGLQFLRAEGYSKDTMPEFYKKIDALVMPSLEDGSPRPPLEAGAAGRLVIGTPVGHFPRLALEGLGIMGPLDGEAFFRFVVERLKFFKSNLELTKECEKGQNAARNRDWPNVVSDWATLLKMTANS